MPSPGPFGDKIFYGWVVVAASLVIACVLLGIRFSFGVFFKSLAGEFSLTRAATSSVFSVYMIIFAVFAVVSGWALDKYGPRLVVVLMGLFTGLSLLMTSQASSLWQLFLGYSVLLAIGTGGTMPVLMSVVSRWFYKKRGFALGIATSGSGLGTLLVAPFAASLISNFDWRTSYIVLGVITWMLVVSLALLLRRDPAEIGALPDGVKSDTGRTQVLEKEESRELPGFSLSGASKKRSFWLMLVVWLLFAFCLTLIITHVVAYATDTGISTIEASTVVGIMGGVNILGRLLMGPVSDRVGRKIPGVFCAVIGAVALVWLIYSHNLWMFYLFAVVFGFSWGGIGVTLASLVGDIFGGSSLGTIMGVLEIGFALGSAIGPAVGGFVFDVTGNYILAFATAAAIMLIAGVLIALTKRETKV
jgi:MFS family permease